MVQVYIIKESLSFVVYMLNCLETKNDAQAFLPNNARVEADAGLDETRFVCKFFTIKAE